MTATPEAFHDIWKRANTERLGEVSSVAVFGDDGVFVGRELAVGVDDVVDFVDEEFAEEGVGALEA